MARGDPGEGVVAPNVTPVDQPRKITPRMEGSPIGEGLAQVGEAVQRKYQSDAATWAGDQLAQLRVSALTSLDKAKDGVTGDPGDFALNYQAGFDKQSAPLIQAAQGNAPATQMLSKGIRDLRDSLWEHNQRWEAEQRVGYRQESVQNNLSTQLPLVEAHPEIATQVGSTLMDQINSIGGDQKNRFALARTMHEQVSVAAANGLARQNPQSVLKGLNDPDSASADLKGVMSGLSDGARDALRQKANNQLGEPVYGALANKDTKSAQATLDSVKSIMDPHTHWELQRTVDAQVKEKENEQKQDISDRFQDSMQAAEFGLKSPITVTRSELNVLYPKDAQRHWDGLQTLAAAGAQSKQYDQMTPEQVAADVHKSEPTVGGPEAAFAIKGYEMRARAAEQSLKARSQDPAQFAIDSKLGWQPLDLTKPEDALANLRSRANSQPSISEQTGVNTPLLSKQETQQFTSWLSAQPPDARLQTLAALRTSLPSDQAYGSLMRQVAPGSPLTAIAGATLDKPSGASAPNWYDPKFTTSPIVGQRILEGEAILKAKDEKGIKSPFPMPKDEDLKDAFASAVGGSSSDLFRGRPDTLESYYAAYKAYYAAESSRQGVSNGVISPSIAERAAESVIGHATTFGHSDVVVPAGMDPTKFEGTVQAASDAALKEAGYSDKDTKALSGYGLRELGDTLGTGRYVIINGAGDPLKSKDGKRSVILDLSQAKAVDKKPEPDTTPDVGTGFIR